MEGKKMKKATFPHPSSHFPNIISFLKCLCSQERTPADFSEIHMKATAQGEILSQSEI